MESEIPGKRAVAYYAKDLSLHRVCPQVPVIIEKVETIADIVTREADDNSNSCLDITSVSNGVLENLKFSLQKCRENVKGEVKVGTLTRGLQKYAMTVLRYIET